MALSEGELTALMAGGFLLGTKVFDLVQSRWGSRATQAINREQALYNRIAILEARIDTKDTDCEKRIDVLEARVETNHRTIEGLRKENDRLEGEVHRLRWEVRDVKPPPPGEEIL